MAQGPAASGRAETRCSLWCLPRSGTADDAELLHAGLEGGSLESQDPGRATVTADPPTRLLENRGDVLALDVLETPRLLFRASPGRRRHDGAELEATPGRQDDGPLDDVLQLAHVPGPVIRGQPLQDVRAHVTHFLPHLRRVQHGEMSGQARDVLLPFS